MPDVAVIPRPVLLETTDGPPFVLTAATILVVDSAPELVAVGVLAADLLGRLSGRPVEVRYTEGGAPSVVRLRLSEDLPAGDEAYRLVVSEHRVDIDARSAAGLVRAVVTLRQTVSSLGDGTLTVPALRVEDHPRYAWRGLSIDVARHFFTVDDLKAIIGLLAHYKLNVLHLHLTDDQGWRVHLPSRPHLTRASAGTSVGGGPGGFYNPAQLAEIVEHAAARGIRVVPEIDVPGHVNAATHAYGDLTPSGEPTDVYTGIEVGFSRLHDDLPATRPFLRDVFTDLAAMTPGEYVHIGGDEVLTMDHDEYARLVGYAASVVRDAGKKVVGWQEIASTPLEPGTVVQYWDINADPAPFVAAAQAGAHVLMSPGSRAYLDMKYDATTELGLEWAGHIELRDAYDWEPSTLIPGVPPESVIGVEAAVWTETLTDLGELTSMLLPRLAAVAEVAWTAPQDRDWDDFAGRVAQHAPFWDRVGFRWHASPQVSWPGPGSAPGAAF
ncbi:family 20 glycosylhydrolase [Cellulomonas fimi]|uniref:beta-N-acetylhexosaminidase n=1 Tax=Cellulomonas fimi (strain ATCC 484 / DSM 20113 / JCM 1341 / CCUG 24087 / LMG 16345 / NBRC 15513 / NCIMB 8980 / NCTC 7547 / NRS-133) TaxID=590998 RepID=F4GZ82_CELFA|nr:family 20 glycosylhydrolase [Cellulomonas fimi]AEE47198.1 Glycoside hydrolase, family 20, catalytic core [Cellulomonas fimi ATCC 484]NNH08887.1 family 20 glycosylhydrolase [Cellulomonas fimi]VEH35559.1 Beta-N-acetylhexosaminidase [Cellulomonas fimi]